MRMAGEEGSDSNVKSAEESNTCPDDVDNMPQFSSEVDAEKIAFVLSWGKQKYDICTVYDQKVSDFKRVVQNLTGENANNTFIMQIWLMCSIFDYLWNFIVRLQTFRCTSCHAKAHV